jgi:GTPase Era involved in 16S rRNA processing
MAAKPYTASLRKAEGRTGWTVIFRHPARFDSATGKAGGRVHRGLNTTDGDEAETLREQLNQLLAEPKYHSIGARAEAAQSFDPRVVAIFYEGMASERPDYLAVREAAIPLPTSADADYRRVLLLGTTGAGKTTLVRQLIGTDPETERFPSTSTAKTTVHDTEIILTDGPWRTIVTFASYDEVREYLRECITTAVLAAWRGASDAEVLRHLLVHVNQRFRFNYVLGRGPSQADTEADEYDDNVDADQFELAGTSVVDLSTTNATLTRAVEAVRRIATQQGAQLREDLQASDESDQRVIDELFEEELDNLLRDDEACQEIADDLIAEIERRFEPLERMGSLKYSRQDWPLSWEWETTDRAEFLRAVLRFSSNYAPLFGQLLTPLVNGVRVAGPFKPSWLEGTTPRLVLLDGEGLGHTPKSSASVSTSVTRRIEQVDAVLLVDNAEQPMQAAPVAVMRELVASGNGAKLIVAFTHFDRVTGDNIPTVASRQQHVIDSAENVLAAIGEELGPFAERILRQRLTEGRVFLGGIDRPLTRETKTGLRTINELGRLVGLIDAIVERPPLGPARPVYDRMNLVLAVKAAAEAFHEAWFPRLGLSSGATGVKEHWARIKALSRRLAARMADEYFDLKPVADLRKALQDRIYVFIQNPLRWDPAEPSDAEKQALFDAFAEEVGRRMLAIATDRVWDQRAREWQAAYDLRGKGSTFDRAHIIGEQIYDPAAPVPDVTPSPDRNLFLKTVAEAVRDAAEGVGAILE